MQRDLAEHAATDRILTSLVMRPLEQMGLVERRAHPSDRRAKSLAPTAAGVALANRAIVAVEDCDREFFGLLGARTRPFAADLRTLRDR
uniref:MarR family winged helix-turn-helix transcriptional regulator n=1 Tax=Nocardia brasiliensis TaxID=37326 RepID=UPI0024589A56